MQALHQHQFDFHSNRGVPEFLVWLTGGKVDEGSWDNITDAFQAGVLFARAGGTINTTEISGGSYPVAASVGSNPNITDSNELSGSEQDELYWGNMDPAPAPPPPQPPDFSSP